AYLAGGTIIPGVREYGRAEIEVIEPKGTFDGFDKGEKMTVWMSHGDHVDQPPPGFCVTARSNSAIIGPMRDTARPFSTLFSPPEVAHTPRGGEVISNFLFDVCHADPSWTSGAFIDDHIVRIADQVGNSRVIAGLSGGVDSAVAAALVHRA